MHTNQALEYLLGATGHESTEKTLLQQPAEHLREVHTEKYDHNVVVKANPTYLYLS